MSDKKEVLKFSLALQTIDVELENPENKEVEKFILREMDGVARDSYISFISKRMKSDSKGDTQVTNFDGLQANLLHSCLFRVTDQGKETAVPMGTIQKWPSRVVGALFDKAKEISGMDDDAEEEAGND